MQSLVTAIVARAAESGPLALLVEDAHWLDSASWEVLRREADAAGRWRQVLPHALAAVDDERTAPQPARARVLAFAGRFDEALLVLERLPEGSWKRAALDVAASAESAHPDIARDLYNRVAAGLRDRRTKHAREELAAITARLAVLDQAGSKE